MTATSQEAHMADEKEHDPHDHADHDHDHAHHEHRALSYEEAVTGFREDKDDYFRNAPRSPIPAAQRTAFSGLAVLPGRYGVLLRGPDARAVHRRGALALRDPDLGWRAAPGASGGGR